MKKLNLALLAGISFLGLQSQEVLLKHSLDNNLAFHSLQDFLAQSTETLEQKITPTFVQNLNYLSPTNAHLVYAVLYKYKSQIDEHLNNLKQNQFDVLKTVLAKEKQSAQKGFRVLYHSTKPAYYAQHYIDTCICKLYQKTIYNNVINAPHILKLRQPFKDIAVESKNEQIKRRISYLENTRDDIWDYSQHSYYLLCANPAITCNASRWYECSFLPPSLSLRS